MQRKITNPKFQLYVIPGEDPGSHKNNSISIRSRIIAFGNFRDDISLTSKSSCPMSTYMLFSYKLLKGDRHDKEVDRENTRRIPPGFL